MTARKRRRSQGKLKSIEALKRQMQDRGLLDGNQVVFTDTEGPKLSTVLLDFIKPYQESATTDEAHEKLVAIAVISWNAAILTGKDRKELIDTTVNAIVKTAGDDWRKETEDIIQIMIKRKERYYADDRRLIVDYRVYETEEGHHLSVASFVKA